MTRFFREKKVPNGKLLQVHFTTRPAPPPALVTIQTFSITGDFFIHPEESISLLEAECLLWHFPSSIADRLASLDHVIQNHNIQIVGFSPIDLVELVEEALHDEK